MSEQVSVGTDEDGVLVLDVQVEGDIAIASATIPTFSPPPAATGPLHTVGRYVGRVLSKRTPPAGLERMERSTPGATYRIPLAVGEPEPVTGDVLRFPSALASPVAPEPAAKVLRVHSRTVEVVVLTPGDVPVGAAAWRLVRGRLARDRRRHPPREPDFERWI